MRLCIALQKVLSLCSVGPFYLTREKPKARRLALIGVWPSLAEDREGTRYICRHDLHCERSCKVYALPTDLAGAAQLRATLTPAEEVIAPSSLKLCMTCRTSTLLYPCGLCGPNHKEIISTQGGVLTIYLQLESTVARSSAAVVGKMTTFDL
jgi:hypothetical protein